MKLVYPVPVIVPFNNAVFFRSHRSGIARERLRRNGLHFACASARPVRSVWRRAAMGIDHSFSRSVGKRAVGARKVGVQRPTCRIRAAVSSVGVLCPCGAFGAGQPWASTIHFRDPLGKAVQSPAANVGARKCGVKGPTCRIRVGCLFVGVLCVARLKRTKEGS